MITVLNKSCDARFLEQLHFVVIEASPSLKTYQLHSYTFITKIVDGKDK